MPFINVGIDDVVRQRAPSDARRYVTDTFVGTAYALRRDLFLALDGFRTLFFHQGEEREFCTRMLAAGSLTCLGRGNAVHHRPSPRRDVRRVHVYARRNDLLYAWLDVPMPYLPIHALGTLANGLRHGLRTRRTRWMLEGVLAGLSACLHHRRARHAVDASAYRLHRRLRTRGPVPAGDARGPGDE